MKKTKFFTLIFLILSEESLSQNWQTNLLNNGSFGNNFGTSVGLPINIYTNSINTALFSTGNSLSSPWDFNTPNNPIGDGLRIMPQTGAFGHLDMFTGNQTLPI